MASRSLNDLSPRVRALALEFLAECQRQGLQVLIYCTLRSAQEQADLYASGRTRPGPILTNARPGESLHNPQGDGMAWAFDAVPMLAGKALWNDGLRIATMGAAGEFVGLEWAGRWRGKLRERVHFQVAPHGAKGQL